MNQVKTRSRLSFLLLIAAILSRFLPHPPNFTALGATALYSGKYIKGPWAYATPLVAMFISDIFLGFHATMPFVYGSFIVSIILGRTLTKKNNWLSAGKMTILGSIVFYAVTNFGVWLTTPFYAHNIAGLAQCYLLALPFFGWTILGDISFVALFFTITEFAKQKEPFAKIKSVSKKFVYSISRKEHHASSGN